MAKNEARWDHDSIKIDFNADSSGLAVRPGIASKAEEGWEPITVVPIPGEAGKAWAYFKRDLRD